MGSIESTMSPRTEGHQPQDQAQGTLAFDVQQQQETPQLADRAVQHQHQGTPCRSQQRRTLSLATSLLPGSLGVTNFNDDDEIETAVTDTQAEPEPGTSIAGPLSVSTRVEYSALPSGQIQHVFGLVTVQAGAAPEALATTGLPERQPMDIICVLDKSGSMQGDKIRQVQDATRFLVEQADPKDRLSIVTFDSNASRALHLRNMSTEGKNDANLAVLRLQADGGTSIAAGLDVALTVMEQRRQRNKVSAILLLTDGRDGSTRGRIPELLRRAAQVNCALYAFGFGGDHDAALLSDIAEQAQTPFTFVEDTEKIREAFAGAVGGLTSIVAQNVELSLKCRVPLKEVHTPFPLQRTSPLEARVTIPDMFALERRDILVELAVPAGCEEDGQTVLLETCAQYIDLQQSRLVQTATAVMEAQRVEEPQPEAEPDAEVSAQRERVEVTRTLQEAASASDRGQFEEALHMLDEAEDRMKSAKRKTPVSEALGQELVDARQRMRSRSIWEQGGRAEIRDATQMHKMQRCTNTMQSSMSPSKSGKAMYCSPMQSVWIERSRGNVSCGSLR